MRCMAPDAFCTSPQTSPSAPTEPAASTARMANCSSVPAVMVWAITACAPSQKIVATPLNTRLITSPVIMLRARMRESDVAKAVSTAPVKRWAAVRSRPNACSVSRASRVSPA